MRPEERPPLPGHGIMEDYTRPFLVSAWVLLFCGLFALWATWGLAVALLAAFGVDRAIRRAARR